jgi:hypothetical protein
MSTEPLLEEGEGDVPDSGNGVYYGAEPFDVANPKAIKIVDRNPKRKRLAGFNRNKALQKNDGGKLINENEQVPESKHG